MFFYFSISQLSFLLHAASPSSSLAVLSFTSGRRTPQTPGASHVTPRCRSVHCSNPRTPPFLCYQLLRFFFFRQQRQAPRGGSWSAWPTSSSDAFSANLQWHHRISGEQTIDVYFPSVRRVSVLTHLRSDLGNNRWWSYFKEVFMLQISAASTTLLTLYCFTHSVSTSYLWVPRNLNTVHQG